MSYSCSGTKPPYHLADPYDHSEIPEGARTALERVQQSMARADGPNEADEWVAVFNSENRVVFLYERRGPGFPYSEVGVHRDEDGEWGFAGSGDCRLRSIPKGGWRSAEWSLTEDPEPQDRALEVLATEIECSSGRKLAPDEFRSEVRYEQTRISIAVYAAPFEAKSANCIGNPSTNISIELDEPVGEREIYDVSVYPPRLETHAGEL